MRVREREREKEEVWMGGFAQGRSEFVFVLEMEEEKKKSVRNREFGNEDWNGGTNGPLLPACHFKTSLPNPLGEKTPDCHDHEQI